MFPEWVEHVRAAFDVIGLKPYWIFAIGVGPTGQDDGTQKMATDLYKTDSGMWTEISEPDTSATRQNWTPERLSHMVDYRNKLLGIVRAARPDYFLSLDSDILIHPCGILTLLETILMNHKVQGIQRKFDAVGGKAILSEGSKHMVTYGELNPNGGIRRKDSTGVFATQILMAVKLMTPAAYNIDYEYHRNGEDVGWSLACKRAGLTLGWDGRISNKHIMRPEYLGRVDRRVGW